MERDARVYLWDVQQAAGDIVQFTAGLDSVGYERNALVQAAVERKFEIIGEALNQLSKRSPTLAQRIPQLSRIIGFRNVLIHGYATVDHPQVWRIVRESLPGLRETVSAILAEMGPPEA
jgi:uncharacterized protein with HEPN domain